MVTRDDFEHVRYEEDGGVAWLTLDRPAKKNAIDGALRDELLTAACDVFDDRSECSVLVISGAGDAFSAGADIGELRERYDDQEDLETLTDALSFERFEQPGNAIRSIEKPVIAMIDGYCLGGGLELALACDFRLASSESTFGTPEMGIGKFPGDGATQALPRETNTGTALYLILTGESIDAETAREFGLVQETLPPDELEGRTRELAERVASYPTASLVLGKNVTKLSQHVDTATGVAMEDLFSKFVELTPERQRLVAEFLEE